MLLITNFRDRHPKTGKLVPRKLVPAKISSLLRYCVEYGWEVTLKRLKGFCWQPVFLQDDSEHRSFLHCRKIFSRIFEISRLYYRVNVSKRFRGFVSTWIKSGTSKYSTCLCAMFLFICNSSKTRHFLSQVIMCSVRKS